MANSALPNVPSVPIALTSQVTGTLPVTNGGTGVATLPYPTQPFRLTTESNVPVSTSDRTSQATLYLTPYLGGLATLYDGSKVRPYAFSQVSLTLTGLLTATRPHDVFLYDNAGILTLEVLAWTNDTTRATALTWQNGLLCKSATPTRLYVGTIYSTGTGTTEDSLVNRYVANYFNPILRPMKSSNGNAHVYTTSTWREWNNGTGVTKLRWVSCLGGEGVAPSVTASLYGNGTFAAFANLGLSTTTTPIAATNAANPLATLLSLACPAYTVVAAGLNYITPLQYGQTGSNYSDCSYGLLVGV